MQTRPHIKIVVLFLSEITTKISVIFSISISSNSWAISPKPTWKYIRHTKFVKRGFYSRNILFTEKKLKGNVQSWKTSYFLNSIFWYVDLNMEFLMQNVPSFVVNWGCTTWICSNSNHLFKQVFCLFILNSSLTRTVIVYVNCSLSKFKGMDNCN